MLRSRAQSIVNESNRVREDLNATADSVGQLDSYNREMGNYELLPGSNS